MWFNYLSKLSFTYGFREIYGVYKNYNVMQFVHGQSLYDFLQTHRVSYHI
jgi:hypothetical protein